MGTGLVIRPDSNALAYLTPLLRASYDGNTADPNPGGLQVAKNRELRNAACNCCCFLLTGSKQCDTDCGWCSVSW